MRKKIEKTNKEKMIELFTACLNNKSFYDAFYKTEKNTNKEKITSGYHTDIPTRRTYYRYWDNGSYADLEKLKEWGYRPVIQKELNITDNQTTYVSSLSISFEDSPPLNLSLVDKEVGRTEDEKIELSKTFKYQGFWKWLKIIIPSLGDTLKKEIIIKNQIAITNFYRLSHGSIKEELTLEEGKFLTDIYELKIKEIEAQIDLDKLNKRIAQFVK